MSAKWIRVSKAHKCPICDRDSWCTLCPDLQLILCMRVKSPRLSKNEMGGWLHPLNRDTAKKIPKAKEPPMAPTINAPEIMRSFSAKPWPGLQDKLADSLGVSTSSLTSLGCAWASDHHAWAFPMVDGDGNIVGIRLRSDAGQKWAVLGSRQGLFVPRVKPGKTVFLTEGPTDTAAALTIGLFAIGRPQCRGCISHTQVTINRLGIRQAVMVVDNDRPGIDGAKQLANELQIPCCRVILPAHDMRQFVNFGGTKQLLDSLVDKLVWQNPE